jgi:hypothetical protein
MQRSEEVILLQFILSGIGWPLILAFAVVALVYFLAPPLGYDPRKRICIAVALWLLLATMALIMLRIAIVALIGLEDSLAGSGGASSGTQEAFVAIALISNFLETGAFILALILFVVGLMMLKRIEFLDPRPRRDPRLDVD